jgi:hypothetical protein
VRLRINTIYYFKYWHFHQDQFPALYVLFSTVSDTWGLNIHYLGQVWNQRSWRFRRFNFFQTRDMLARYRQHPATNKFFKFLESETFTRMEGHDRYRIIQRRWPRMIECMYRQYKSPLVQVVWSIQKNQLAELTDPQAWREHQRRAREAYLENVGKVTP